MLNTDPEADLLDLKADLLCYTQIQKQKAAAERQAAWEYEQDRGSEDESEDEIKRWEQEQVGKWIEAAVHQHVTTDEWNPLGHGKAFLSSEPCICFCTGYSSAQHHAPTPFPYPPPRRRLLSITNYTNMVYYRVGPTG